MYSETPAGRGQIKNLILIDQADVEIIKLSFLGIFVDISIKQVKIAYYRILGWRNLHIVFHESHE